jgi:hypothetical protein
MTWLQRLRVLLRVQARLVHSLRASCHCSALFATVLVVSCARSGLDPGELTASGDPVPLPSATPPLDAGTPMPVPSPGDAGMASGGSLSAPACIPSAEQ